MYGLRRLLETLLAMVKREPWWAEFWSATTAIVWSAFFVFSPGHFGLWPSMRVLTQIADSEAWHVMAAGLGLLQLGFLVCDRRWLRWVAALLVGWFWAILTVGEWAATPWAPSVAVYAGWCGVNVFSVLRLLRYHG
jgi:hypothetical protein